MAPLPVPKFSQELLLSQQVSVLLLEKQKKMSQLKQLSHHCHILKRHLIQYMVTQQVALMLHP